MKKKTDGKLHMPSFLRCSKAALWIMAVTAVSGVLVACYDWLVLEIANLII